MFVFTLVLSNCVFLCSKQSLTNSRMPVRLCSSFYELKGRKMDPSKIKSIILDLDGTLLTNDKTILPYTENILHSLEKQGIKLIFATGRTLRSKLEFNNRFS